MTTIPKAIDYFVINIDGKITYELRDGRAPSAFLQELREQHGPDVKLGMTLNPPKEALKDLGVEELIQEGSMVVVRAYGGSYFGRVTWRGRKNAKVRITLQSGREKIITRPLTDMTVTR